MDGLEHKDERLHVAQDAGWRDKLARLRRDLTDDDTTEGATGDTAEGGE